MPLRLYEIARELNYTLDEIQAKSSDVGLIANSPFSIVPDVIAEKVRKAFPKQEENSCLQRQKPKVKRVAKPKAKAKPKKKKEEIVPEIAAEVQIVTSEGVEVTGVVEEELVEVTQVVAEENVEIQSEATVEKESVQESEVNEESAPVKEGSAVQAQKLERPKRDVFKNNELLLGKIAEENKEDVSEDSFAVGRIVSESPSVKKNEANSKKQKRKRAIAEQDDVQTQWSQKYNYNVQPLPKKVQNETKGSKLQRMQLVYGHEIPKKFRTRSGQRQASEESKLITVPIAIRDLSEELGVKANDVIKYLMTQGLFLTITDKVEKDMAETVALEFNIEARFTEEQTEEAVIKGIIQQTDKEEDLEGRPPVITIMGHVDHGKTTLLDTIRKSQVARGEKGGITQHIGGYQVEKNGQVMTFLDTPGHAAFTSMRSRGAQITDIVILVVAANDGVMPQTEEAVNHAKAAGVPIIVAVNKMDLEDANPNKVKEQLAAMDLIPEEWSGSTPYVPVSALKGEGLDDLLEMIHLQTEMMELKADFKCLGEGIVVEAHMETGRGVVANVLVRQGFLNKGDAILCGKGYGFIRMMEDENSKSVKKAGPSKIVKLMGLSVCPTPGELFNVMPDIKKAKEMGEDREAKDRELRLKEKESLTMESLMTQLTEANVKNVNVVIKGDMQGSVEAIKQAVSELGNEEVKAKVVHSGIGAITESDILLAKTSGSVVLAFNVNADSKARRLAMDEGVEIKRYSIIYELLEYIQSNLEGMLEPDKVEEVVGEVEVREVFRISNIGNIAGSYVKTGYVERNLPVRLVRDGKVVYTGKIQALRRFKEDVKRVESRYECGVRLENYEDIKIEDILEVYTIQEIKKQL